MQDYDWNDLKYLLALHRVGTFAEAARLTGVDETTVARRVKRLESTLDTILLIKLGAGRYELSDASLNILNSIEKIENENHAIRERLGQHLNKVVGSVRISSVPFITNRILIPNLERLKTTSPDVTIELVPDARNIDLTKREADLAIRFSRPSDGGLGIKAKKLGEMEFDVFCSSNVPVADEDALEWIGYDETHAFLPQSHWIEKLRVSLGQRSSSMRLTDLDSVQSAVVTGYGKSVLPKQACLRDERLRLVSANEKSFEMKRAVWLLSHARQTDRRSHIAAKAWLTNLAWN